MSEVRDIGIDVKAPSATCEDKHCPFHGQLPVRGQIIDGVIVSVKMNGSAVVERNCSTCLMRGWTEWCELCLESHHTTGWVWDKKERNSE